MKKKPPKSSRYYETCSILDCTNPIKARGLCDSHYQQCRARGILPEPVFHGYAGTPDEVRRSIHTQLLRKSQ